MRDRNRLICSLAHRSRALLDMACAPVLIRVQVLVIFIIRTRGNPLKSRAHRLLVLTSLIVVAIAIALPFTPVGSYFGFVPPPAKFYFILGGMLVVYLLVVELAKRGFYRWMAASQKLS